MIFVQQYIWYKKGLTSLGSYNLTELNYYLIYIFRNKYNFMEFMQLNYRWRIIHFNNSSKIQIYCYHMLRSNHKPTQKFIP